jgi:DHA2 family multidrug resistance protein
MISAFRNGRRDAAATGQQPGWWKWAVAFTVSLGALMEVIDVSIVNVALPSMQNSMGATLSEIGWVITGYAMANVVIIPLGAWLSDYFGQRNYYIFTLVAFVGFSLMCGLATSLPMLVIARILQGITGGGLMPKAQSILFETFPPHLHGMAQAMFGIGVVVGPAFGPTLGGWLTDSLGWRSIFFINLPVGIIAVLMSLLFIPDKPIVRRGSVDWAGIFLLATSLGTLQVALEEGQSEGWFESLYITGLVATSVITTVLFIWRELTALHPAVNLRVFRHRALAAGSVFSIILGIGLFGTTFVIPIFTQNILHFTATQTGEILIPGSLLMAVWMPLVGRLLAKHDARIMIGFGSVILTGVMFVLAHVNADWGAHDFFWPLIFRGIGLATLFIPLSVATLGSVPRSEVAAASGVYNLTRQVGGSVGIAVLATFLSRRQLFHYEVLGEHVSAWDPGVAQTLQQMQGYLQSRGYDMQHAYQGAVAMLRGLTQQQSMVLAFQDVYILVGVMFALSLCLLVFLGRGAKGRMPVDAH